MSNFSYGAHGPSTSPRNRGRKNSGLEKLRMDLRKFLLISAVLSACFFVSCGGGSLAPGGQPADSSLNEQGQTATINMRLSAVRTQAAFSGVATIVINVLDDPSQNPVIPEQRFELATLTSQIVTLNGIPVGRRILRIQGFTNPPNLDNGPGGSGEPIAEPGFDLDLQVNVQPGEETRAEVTIGQTAITGNVVSGGIPTGQPGVVIQLGDQPGVDETQPEVDIFGLQGAIVFRRSSGATDGDVVAEIFRTDSLNFTGPTQDIDGQAAGIVVNTAGPADRQTPGVGVDQLGNFTVIWADQNTADVHGRSYMADATPLGPEVADLTDSNFAGIDPLRPVFASTTNPDPPGTGQGFGGEVRHLVYLGNQGGNPVLSYRTAPPDNLNCDPGADCPPGPIIDCSCLIEDNLLTSLMTSPPPTLTSNFSFGLFSDGFSSMVAYEDGSDVYVFTTRPWVGLLVSPGSEFKVNTTTGVPGEVDVAPVGFRFSEGVDRFVVVYEQDQMVYARSYEFRLGTFGEVAGPVLLGPGTQPRAASSSNTEFLATWVSPQGEVMIDALRHSDLGRLSTNPPHVVSDSAVMPGTSSRPRIAVSSFGSVVVWEGTDSGGNRGVFEKRFGAAFQP